MNNALRTLAFSAALGACESRDPLAQADEICVHHVDTTHQLTNDTTYPGPHPHAEAETIRNLISTQIALTASERGVDVCSDDDARGHVSIHTTVEGAYNWASRPTGEWVSNNSDLSISVPVEADRLVHFGFDGLDHGCTYHPMRVINYTNGFDFSNTVSAGLNRSLDCLLEPQYHWKW